MRWALGICLVAGCMVCAQAMAMGVRRRVTVLTQLTAGLRALRVHMLRMLETAPQALSASDCALLRQTGAAMTPGVSAREAWATVCAAESRRFGGLDALTREDREALDGFFDGLGESGRAQQELLLSETIRALAQNLESAVCRAREAERLYGSLGLLVGLMLALIAV